MQLEEDAKLQELHQKSSASLQQGNWSFLQLVIYQDHQYFLTSIRIHLGALIEELDFG